MDPAANVVQVGNGDVVEIGISTCPNDTFAFAGILTKSVDLNGLAFRFHLLDIQQLNDRLFQGHFDVAKTSFHAALKLSEATCILPVGSAIGFGVGPLLLASRDNTEPISEEQTTLCPGEDTTATLLFRLFYGQSTRIEHAVFSDIMPRLAADPPTADFGVCIHEGRFTYQREGLHCVADLGERWESATQAPLPLGGLVARNAVKSDQVHRVCQTIRDSLEWAKQHTEQALPTMRHYAQEFDDAVLMKHVELYVNDWTHDLGDVGRNAIQVMFQQALASGALPSHSPPPVFF